MRHIPVIPHSRSATALIGLIAAFAAPRTPLFAAQDSSLTRLVHQATLENGLQVIVVENHTVPLATVLVAVRNGAFTQDSADQGLAHLYEHMLFHSYRHDPSAFAVKRRISRAVITAAQATRWFTITSPCRRPMSTAGSG